MRYLSSLYDILVLGKEKAVVAFAVAAIGTFVARHGWTLDATWNNYLQAVLLGLLAHLAVYLKSNKS